MSPHLDDHLIDATIEGFIKASRRSFALARVYGISLQAFKEQILAPVIEKRDGQPEAVGPRVDLAKAILAGDYDEHLQAALNSPDPEMEAEMRTAVENLSRVVKSGEFDPDADEAIMALLASIGIHNVDDADRQIEKFHPQASMDECPICGHPGGTHMERCPAISADEAVSVIKSGAVAVEGGLDIARLPKMWRRPIPEGQDHPNGSKERYVFGTYFPLTDLCVDEMGKRSTGEPRNVQWATIVPIAKMNK